MERRDFIPSGMSYPISRSESQEMVLVDIVRNKNTMLEISYKIHVVFGYLITIITSKPKHLFIAENRLKADLTDAITSRDGLRMRTTC